MHTTVLATLALSLAAPQFPPPSIVENGDARGGESSWTKHEKRRDDRGQATIETCDTAPCFAVRNGAAWAQFARLPEGSVGKFLVVLGRGSSERVWPRACNPLHAPHR